MSHDLETHPEGRRLAQVESDLAQCRGEFYKYRRRAVAAVCNLRQKLKSWRRAGDGDREEMGRWLSVPYTARAKFAWAQEDWERWLARMPDDLVAVAKQNIRIEDAKLRSQPDYMLRLRLLDKERLNDGADRPMAARAMLVVDTALVEALADLEHERWSGWEKYREEALFDQGAIADYRWKRQRETSYANLSEREKDSDRAEAIKSIEVMTRHQLPLSSVRDVLRSAIAVSRSKDSSINTAKQRRRQQRLQVAVDALPQQVKDALLSDEQKDSAAGKSDEPVLGSRAADERSARGYLGHASRYPFEDR